MLTIWGRKTSSNVQALMWCVGELQLEHVRHDLGHRFGGLDTPGFGAMNPNRTVPVLRDGSDPPLWETGAILRYLATRYGSGTFWPPDPRPRAHVDKWAEWAKINVALRFTAPVFWRVVRTAEADRDKDAIDAALNDLHDMLYIAERQLGQTAFLAGDDFTLADVQFGHILYRYFDIDIARPDLPALGAYYSGLHARPAYVRHVMVSYDELRVV